MDMKSTARAMRCKHIALAVTAAFLPSGQSYALPTGEAVVAGDVTVARPTAQTMQINQATQKGIVNWLGFSIGASEHVNITQPSASASLLNRVVGNNPSEIFGRLTANGRVFLVNPNGVLFAPGASVEVGSLFASSLALADQDFLAGRYQFVREGNAGSVVNQGTIITANGYTGLIGPQVRNDGVIIARAGAVALAAGDRVALDLIGDGLISVSVDQATLNASVVNTGRIEAEGGVVVLAARSANALLDTVINTSGIVRANALVERNGEIVLEGGDSGIVQVAGTVQAGGSITITAGGALNVGSTVCCFPTQITAGSETITAGSITVGGGATVNTSFGAGSQTITTPGTLLVRGGIQAGDAGFFHAGSGEQRVTAGNVEVRGGTGTNTGAFINSTAGADQTVTVTGDLRITGGASGTGNRAGIVSNGNQTITGNPNIVLTGGAGGVPGRTSNNVFIQATGGETKPQTINARTIELRSGAGNDASATLNAARQVISTIGNVSLFGGAGLGGSNGVRIGGIGGSTLGPTNLTLTVGGDLLLHGGTGNGASLGSSGASTQANTIAVIAGNVTLESEGAGARIGTSGQVPVTPGNIAVTAAGNLQVGQGTAIRANGPITLTADGLVNDGTITNGGGSNNMLLSANSYDLAGGNIQGGSAAVLLRPRDGTRSFGIEAAGDPTLTNHTDITNADLASISTSNFVVFGSGTGTNFTGNMTIGQDAQVNGGAKNLAFFRSSNPGGTTTIGNQGVTTTGDVIVSAGGGAIVSNGIGTVAGDEVQLRAAQSIGTDGARVRTSANALAINGGSAFVTEANEVTVRTVALTVGGTSNVFGNSTAGMFDLATGSDLNVAGTVATGPMAITAGGALNLSASGGQDAVLTSNGGQTISAQSLLVSAAGGQALISNNGSGHQTITVSGGGTGAGVDVRTSGSGLAQIENNVFGSTQTLTLVGGDHLGVNATGVLNPFGPSGAGIIANGNQVISVTGSGANAVRVGSSGALGTSHIRASGSQTITAGSGSEAGSITITGPAANNAFTGIVTNAALGAHTQTISTTGAIDVTAGFAPSQGSNFGTGIFHNRQGLQTVNAGSITVRGGTGGSNNVAFISTNPFSSPSAPGGRDQVINVSGDIAVLGSDAGSNNRATIVANNGTQIINAGGDIIIRAGASGVSGSTNASISTNTSGRQQTINARNIAISGPVSGGIDSFASISGTNQLINTTGNVTLTGGSSGGALAGVRIGGVGGTAATPTNLTMHIGGDLVLTGGAAGNGVGLGSSAVSTQPNTISITAGGSVILNEGSGAGARIGGADGNVGGGTIAISAGNNIELKGVTDDTAIRSTGDVTLSAGGSISEGARGFVLANRLTTSSGGDTKLTGPNQVANFSASAGTDITLNNAGALTVTDLEAGGNATLSNSGNVTIDGPWTAGGTSNISAHSDLVLNAVLTSSNVALEADGSIFGFGAGAIVADTLSTTAGTRTLITGENRVANYQGASGEDLFFFNRGDLNVSSLSAGIANFSNIGAVTISGPWITAGRTSIAASGPGASLSQTAGGHIQADGLNGLSADGSLNLTGPNRISGSLFAQSTQGDVRLNNAGDLDLGVSAGSFAPFTTFGDIAVVNAGALNVTSLSGRNAEVTNTGPMTVSGFWNSAGTTSITTAGPGADLTVSNSVTSQGLMTISVDGVLTVAASGVQVIPPPTPDFPPFSFPQSASLTSFGGQTIGANAVVVSAHDGAIAMINNQGVGDQSIAAWGGGINVRSSGISAGSASSAQIGNFTAGSQTITAVGAGGVDLSSTAGSASITNSVSVQVIEVAGGALTVTASGTRAAPPAPPGFPPTGPVANSASLSSSGGQNISADSLLVSAQDGGLALINNQITGNQTLTVAGGSVDIRSSGVVPPGAGGSRAHIANFVAGASQTIAVTDADQINLNGLSGSALITSGGELTLSIKGTGANAITFGSVGANGSSQMVAAASQKVTAGEGAEQGSITIIGSARNGAGASIISQPTPGGTQTVSTTGLLRVMGGNAGAQNNAAGIFHNGSGLQKISAAGLELRGGTTGNGNGAIIGSNGGTNLANAGDQRFDISGDIVIAAGNGGDALINGGLPGQRQTIYARNIEMSNGVGGTNSFAAIRGGNQEIHASGDVRLTAGATFGADGGVRIGSRTPNPANLALFVGGDLVLTGGSRADNNANIGSSGASGAVSNTIYIETGGSVMLNSGTGAGARIGTGTAVSTGSVEIRAGGDIQLNGGAQPTAIRAGTVTLNAANISEASNGLIVADTLSTTTRGDTLLTGPNRVSSFTAASEFGNVSLTNTSGLLTLGSMDLPGTLSVFQTGDVALGAANAQSATVVMAAGDISIDASGAIAVRGSDTTEGAASAVVSGGMLEFNAGNVALVGGAAPGASAIARGNNVTMTIGGELTVTGGSGQFSPAVLSSGSNIDLTVGGAVRIDAGSGDLSLARIQTEIREGVIHITFPNLSQGGYFVNGVEGDNHHGESGFFTLNKPAKPGSGLLLEYGI
jgi:filamentous hemagglutinin family protein